jgi:hypothetical protein
MGIAAYNRGSKLMIRATDAKLAGAMVRAQRDAEKSEAGRLREQVVQLERDLARARRCIAALRRSKDARLSEARAQQSSSDAAIRILTRLAFPSDCTEDA